MKISIIGCGNVGSATAFALLHSIKPDEIMLIDINKKLLDSEVLDLGHATVSISPKTKIESSTDISKIKNSDFVVLAAGKPRILNQNREELAEENGKIIAELFQDISKFAPNSMALIVTNPSTQMAEIARKYYSKVIAMDNQLDTARLRYFISKELKKPLEEVSSFVTGEHGENMQLNIKDDLNAEQLDKVKEKTLKAGSNIIKGKGYTNWGIAALIVEEIKRIKNGNV